jgi:hypothetical protein
MFMRFIPILALVLAPAMADARGYHGGGYRVHYSGSHHTVSHGGSYRGSYAGSSHRGGHYSNYRTGNRYGRHR